MPDVPTRIRAVFCERTRRIFRQLPTQLRGVGLVMLRVGSACYVFIMYAIAIFAGRVSAPVLGVPLTVSDVGSSMAPAPNADI